MNNEKLLMEIYGRYEKRDFASVLDLLPSDFCFVWPSERSLVRYSGECQCKDALLEKLVELDKNFEFNSYKAENILVENDKAAAQVSLNLTSKSSGETFNATIAHFWTFVDGVPKRLVEYFDTALMEYHSAS